MLAVHSGRALKGYLAVQSKWSGASIKAAYQCHSRWISNGRHRVVSAGGTQPGKYSAETNRHGKLPNVSVVLIGWFGSEERHVMKYCECWRKLGVKDLFVHRPSNLAVLSSRICEQEARDFLAKPKQLNEIVIYHVFSLGGYVFFGTLLKESEKSLRTAAAKHSSIVLDSGPGILSSRYAWSSQSAAIGLLTGGAGLDEKKALRVYESTASVWDRVWGFFSSTKSYERRYKLISEAFNKLSSEHQLYLYSESDAVMPSESIELFIRGQREQGKSVSCKKWPNGSHVQLLRQHKEEYEAELLHFLDETIIRESNDFESSIKDS